MRTIAFFGLRPGRYRHSDYLAGRDVNHVCFLIVRIDFDRRILTFP
jgi:hypothetical protein